LVRPRPGGVRFPLARVTCALTRGVTESTCCVTLMTPLHSRDHNTTVNSGFREVPEKPRLGTNCTGGRSARNGELLRQKASGPRSPGAL